MNMASNLTLFEDTNTKFDVSESGESKSESAGGTIHSDITSEYIPSEICEDRSFVASDTEEQPLPDAEIIDRLDEVSCTCVRVPWGKRELVY